jgi:hypothetical protein
MKDLLQTFPEPKPKNDNGCHFTEDDDKDFVAYNEFGNPENTIHW